MTKGTLHDDLLLSYVRSVRLRPDTWRGWRLHDRPIARTPITRAPTFVDNQGELVISVFLRAPAADPNEQPTTHGGTAAATRLRPEPTQRVGSQGPSVPREPGGR